MVQALLIGFVFSRLVMALAWPATSSGHGLKNLMIDTNFLSFPDDAGAIALANAFQQLGRARILGIASDVNSRFSIPAIDAINTYYGHPNIPLGQNRSVTNATAEPGVDPESTPVFITTIANSSIFPEDIRDGSSSRIHTPLGLYRHILSNAKDKSVTLISIGFFTNLAELYHSRGGPQLITSKVAELVVQGGNFGLNHDRPVDIGYNLGHSLAAAKALEVWPSPVTYLGDNTGVSVLSGAVLRDTPLSNPVRDVYAIFLNGTGLDCPSWDVLVTYFSVMGISEGSFKYGNEGGRIEVFDNGTMRWNYDVEVPHSRRQHFLDLKEPNTTIARKINTLLALLPD